jgi:hypothetical protein
MQPDEILQAKYQGRNAVAEFGDTILSFKNLRRQMAASLDGSETKN